ncbi:DUF4112 domain-containing protein [Pseudanabaena sp. FACHB-2040]|uniref:DUF4112 domain-containing protein n=1 Tax=Pseudanabaena sp. FACHB-2040 TaxID=2692859 RepID=UPI001685F888|nr:DUF4112 domain-containing protein [Pseudanabaena sp. FACHB-2040]MBD2256352.1 DUF4112 domain-containing protein [Pseudanabaena sp. FACHB-2040]
MDTVAGLKTLNRIRRISRLMDTAIGLPGTKFRIGLDPLLGLIPGGGDLITAGISAYIVFLAARFKLPAPVLRKMALNVALESVVGTVPLVGDLFDATFKANLRNLSLLEKHLQADSPDLEEADPLNLESAVPGNIRQTVQTS